MFVRSLARSDFKIPQSPNRWRSCRVRVKMGEGVMEEGAMEGDSGMVLDVEGVWILDGKGC